MVVPLGQDVHTVTSSRLEYVPTGQGLQLPDRPDVVAQPLPLSMTIKKD